MRDRIGDFADARVVLVTFTDAARLADYVGGRALPFPVIRVPVSTYQSYGFGRASARRVWAPGVLVRYAALLRRGEWRRLRRPVEDTRQLGGDIVVDDRGRLAWGHWSEGPDDRPDVDDLLAAVRRADTR